MAIDPKHEDVKRAIDLAALDQRCADSRERKSLIDLLVARGLTFGHSQELEDDNIIGHLHLTTMNSYQRWRHTRMCPNCGLPWEIEGDPYDCDHCGKRDLPKPPHWEDD